VTRPHREHHAAGVRSSEGWTKDPHPLQRQITGDCLSAFDTKSLSSVDRTFFHPRTSAQGI
jgi:hypothetical protein